MVVFTWAVAGDSRHQLDTTTPFANFANSVRVTDFTTTAMLTATGSEGTEVLLDLTRELPETTDSATYVSTNQDISLDYTEAAEPATFFVPWQAGQPVTFDFKLATSASVTLQAADAQPISFKAIADSDFFNTATLISADIYSADMTFHDTSAALQGAVTYPVSVPEPALGAWLSLVFGIGAFARHAGRRSAPSGEPGA